MKYTKEEIEACRNADILSVVQGLSYGLIKRGNYYFIEEHDSLCIFAEKNQWYWFSQGKGGNALDFAVEGPPGYKFAEAVEAILKISAGAAIARRSEKKPKEAEPQQRQALVVPPKAKNNKRVIAYLVKSRGIDYELVCHLLKKGLLYQAAKTNNAVFVAFDEKGEVKHLTLRGTVTDKRFVMDAAGSDKRYGFMLERKAAKNERSKDLYVFESPIDLLSYITIQKEMGECAPGVYLAQSGTATAATDHYLSTHSVNRIFCCTDNDDAGAKAYNKLKSKYPNIKVIRTCPVTKDFNSDLMSCRQAECEQKGKEKI